MKLFRRVVAEHRLVLAIIALAVAGNLGVYLLIVAPMQGRVASGEARTMAVPLGRSGPRSGICRPCARRRRASAPPRCQLQKFYHQVLPDNLTDAGGRAICDWHSSRHSATCATSARLPRKHR